MTAARFKAVETLREVIDRLREDMGHVDDGYCLACDDEPDASLSLIEQLAEAADDAIGNTLVLLPVTGSDNAGYRPSGSTQTTLMATLEEWNDAAQSVCNLHALLAAVRAGSASLTDGQGDA